MKLNLRPFKSPPPPPPPEPTGYESPIGWWKVTTEGDCEGRSVRDLGTFYGHVAEIALAMQENPMYEYGFHALPNLSAPAKRSEYVAFRKECHISFDIDSGTWPSSYRGGMNSKQRAEYVSKWFDSPDVIVEESNYYKAVRIRLAPHLVQ